MELNPQYRTMGVPVCPMLKMTLKQVLTTQFGNITHLYWWAHSCFATESEQQNYWQVPSQVQSPNSHVSSFCS